MTKPKEPAIFQVIDREAYEKLTPAQRTEIAPLLAEAAELFERNPLLSYHPHPKQIPFHKSRSRIKAFFGGNRSGKSTAGLVDDLIQAVDRSALPPHLIPYKKWEPPFKCRIVSPDFTSTMEGVIFEKLREWVPRDQLIDGSWAKAYDKQRRVLRFANGSWFDFLTSEQDIDKFSGADLHRVHFDEEPPGEKGFQIFRECSMRLIDHGGDIVFSMTPLFGMSWVFEQVWEQRGPEVTAGVYVSEAEGGLTVCTVDMDDNPHLNQAAKRIALQGLSGPELKARKEGRFVHFAGLVYEEFAPDTHVTGETAKDHLRGQDVLVGIDPGIKTTAILFAAFDGDNDMLIFDEIILGEESAIPENAARLIREKEAEWGVEPIYYVIDPAARHRSLVNAEQVATAYMRAGINTVPGQNAVEPGIFEVKRRLERTTKGAGAGLYISKACSRLIWEFGRYRMDPKAEGFAVVKKDDHALDVARYLSMARPVAPHTLPKPRSHQTHWTPGTAPPVYAGVGQGPSHPFGDSF